MADAELVRALGLDPDSMSREQTQGKDGVSASYTSGDQVVIVTRSVVSGVTVVAMGPRSGAWELGRQ